MVASMFAAALAAGGLANLPQHFEVQCVGKELTQLSLSPVRWSTKLTIDLYTRKYSIDGGKSWKLIRWIGDDHSAMFLRFEQQSQEVLDLGKGVYNYMGSRMIDGKTVQVIEHGDCVVGSQH